MPDPISTFVFLTQSVGVGTAAAAWVASNLATIALIGGSIAIGNYQRRKAQRRARDAYNASLQDRLVMTATTDGARSRIYGRARNVDGVLFKATRGNNSEFYTLIVALAGHEVDAIEDVYFNDELLTLDGNGYVQTAPWMQTQRKNGWADIVISGGSGSVTLPFTPVAGSVAVTAPGQPADNALGYTTDVIASTVLGTQVNVTGATFTGTARVSYQYDVDDKSFARVRKYLGAASQDLSADLVADFPALCTSADKFRGIALLRVDLEYSQDAFPTGVPQISAVVRGARVYDPRNATTSWTQNPALIARDWAMLPNGGNLAAVDDTAIAAAANACDVDTTFSAPSGNVTMDTYQAGIVCKLDADPSATLSEMVEAMAGRWGFSGGVLTLVAGATRGTVATITEDWITDASQITITPAPPRSELVNAYRPNISNRLNKYQAEPAPPVIASTYVTDDGQQLDAEITMAAVTHPLHAQHICGVLLRDARQSLTVTLPCNLRAFKLQLFDVVAVTLSRFGWSAKLFEVMGWRFTLNGLVQLTLKEHSAAVYTPDAGFADLGYSDNTGLPAPWTVETVHGLAVTSGATALTDGSVVTRTQVSWTAATDANVLQAGRIEIQWAEAYGTTATEFPSTTEAGNTTSTVITGLRSGIVYVFRARYINAAGVRSRWSLHVVHKVVAENYGQVGGGNLFANSSFEVDSNGDGLSDSWLGLTFGQTGAVTYTRVAGIMGGNAQRINAAALGQLAGDSAGIYQFVPVAGMAGRAFRASGFVIKEVGSFKVRAYVDYFNGAAFVSSGNVVLVTPSATWTRYATPTNYVPAGVTHARIFWAAEQSTAVAQARFAIDAVQFEFGDVVTGYSPGIYDNVSWANPIDSSNVGQYVGAGSFTEILTWQVAAPSGNIILDTSIAAFPVNCKLLVTVSFSVAYTNTSSGSKTAAMRIRFGPSGSPLAEANGTSGVKFFQLTTTSPTNEQRFTVSWEFDYLTSWGAPEFDVTHQLTGSGTGGALNPAITDAYVKLEAIKR